MNTSAKHDSQIEELADLLAQPQGNNMNSQAVTKKFSQAIKPQSQLPGS
jgi:hypothetical protein